MRIRNSNSFVITAFEVSGSKIDGKKFCMKKKVFDFTSLYWPWANELTDFWQIFTARLSNSYSTCKRDTLSYSNVLENTKVYIFFIGTGPKSLGFREKLRQCCQNYNLRVPRNVLRVFWKIVLYFFRSFGRNLSSFWAESLGGALGKIFHQSRRIIWEIIFLWKYQALIFSLLLSTKLFGFLAEKVQHSFQNSNLLVRRNIVTKCVFKSLKFFFEISADLWNWAEKINKFCTKSFDIIVKSVFYVSRGIF